MKKIFKMNLFLTLVLTYCWSVGSCNQPDKGKPVRITFIKNEADKKIEVIADGKLFTVFTWPDNICKPVLYPILTSAGTEITRGFPVKPRTGEQVDHPHQIGMWLTYGNVNGLDYWGNGSQGLGTRNANGGLISHVGIEKTKEGKGEGLIFTNESWTDNSGKELLKEHTEFRFSGKGQIRIIDRITTLTAGEKEVNMPDTKEGMFGIRVARQLELPSKGALTLWGTEGKPVKYTQAPNEGITGNYLSSEGITGEAVWGTRARWMDLYGSIGNEKISLVIIDHPQNQSYPTYWHARGYGLFSANPLGVKDFTQGKETLNFTIPAGKSTTFRYRFIISSGYHLTTEKINTLADEFAEKYKMKTAPE